MKDLTQTPAPLRDPNRIMRLSQMGAAFPTRLSFLRILLRRLMDEKPQLRETIWDMDDAGFGYGVFTIALGGQDYSLVAITQPLAPEDRTDRVIAEKWDAAFVLFDGIPGPEDIARIRKNAPLQEAGRFGPKDLCLSRANKSVRLFDAIINAQQTGTAFPEDEIRKVGYLMRTTAVYGNGKFGLADRDDYAGRPAMMAPFQAEMLTVWLIRHFTHRLIEHLAGAALPVQLRRTLGIGNSTGLGMAPFLVSHPLLLHSWVACRETAFARVLDADVTPEVAVDLHANASQIATHLEEWNVPDPKAQTSIESTRQHWHDVVAGLSPRDFQQPGTLRRIWETARDLSPEVEELALAWMTESFPELVDGLTDCLANPFRPQLDVTMPSAELRAGIDAHWPAIQDLDFDCKDTCAQFWYVSEAKQEPRLGQRATDPGAELESPLDVARRMSRLRADLAGCEDALWQFLLRHPEHRDAARRMQALMANVFSEIRDNLLDVETAPIDMLRFKLAMFGATKFDPKSSLWTRITLFSGGPLADEIADGTAQDHTWMPVF